MFLRWLAAILLLPGTVLVVVPAAILAFSREAADRWAAAPVGSSAFWSAVAIALPGLGLALWTMSLFIRHGDGTAAPWDPPTRFVVKGPYRFVRNPMILGVLLLLVAESVFFQSSELFVWAVVFFAGNSIYFPLVEEPGLRKRFGPVYEVYCEYVGRWLPRFSAWDAPGRSQGVKE